MKTDEAQYAQTAVEHGGAPLPMAVKMAMRFAADVMRQTASRVWFTRGVPRGLTSRLGSVAGRCCSG